MVRQARTVWGICIVVLTGILLLPTAVRAQQASGIAGEVRDTSGALLPGVTVEAASPVLIEKVRSVVTDGQGRYNIVELRPGTYVVTFTLAGFSTFRRDGIVLTAGFTAAVNADLQVGALTETVTVTGASPLVDTQNVRQQASVSDELLSVLPSGSKGLMGLSRLVPGMSGSSDSGGGSGIYNANTAFATSIHGKGNGKLSYDGMQTNNQAATGAMSYVMNPATVEEIVILTGGISAESDASGFLINLVPKEGGNVFKGGIDGTYANDHMQSNNLSDRVRATGVTEPSRVQQLYDLNIYLGGPIKRDRLWFFAATRFAGSQNGVAGIYFNKTRGTPFYTPDLDHPAFRKEWLKGQSARITWQVSPKNKVNGFSDTQSFQRRGSGGLQAPEAIVMRSFWPNGLYQVTWTSPVTSKFLLEAGVSYAQNDFPNPREKSTDIFGFTVNETDISILETSTGLRYNARDFYQPVNEQDRYVERFAASYVTGSHAFKTGFQLQQGVVN